MTLEELEKIAPHREDRIHIKLRHHGFCKVLFWLTEKFVTENREFIYVKDLEKFSLTSTASCSKALEVFVTLGLLYKNTQAENFVQYHPTRNSHDITLLKYLTAARKRLGFD